MTRADRRIKRSQVWWLPLTAVLFTVVSFDHEAHAGLIIAADHLDAASANLDQFVVGVEARFTAVREALFNLGGGVTASYPFTPIGGEFADVADSLRAGDVGLAADHFEAASANLDLFTGELLANFSAVYATLSDLGGGVTASYPFTPIGDEFAAAADSLRAGDFVLTASHLDAASVNLDQFTDDWLANLHEVQSAISILGGPKMSSKKTTPIGDEFAAAADSLRVSAVPEPSSLALLMTGMCSLCGFCARRRRASPARCDPSRQSRPAVHC